MRGCKYGLYSYIRITRAKSKALIAKSNTCVCVGFWAVWRDGLGLILIGREAMEMKWKRFGERGYKGAWSKEKRMSLKLASQTRKKVVGAQRWKEWRWRGRMVKR